MREPTRPETTPCHDPGLLQQLLLEQLEETDEARVQEHVTTCTDCQRALEHAAGNESLWREVSENLGGLTPTDDDADAQLREIRGYLAPSDDPAMLGRLGHYEIRGMIGRGSTGIVLKAHEPRLNRFVAIKLLAPEYRASGAARRRFEREGRAIAAVTHDHVVPIHAVDEYEGLPYIVMQYVPGLSLQQRLDRDGPFDSCAVARLGLQVASALAAAHAQGIVHRDVKPANVILEDNVERALVMDFGLARVADEMSMTHSGTITGTPQFMSPEQARGESTDVRSDLFSLGSLLYAAATGRPPFRAETLFGVIHRVSESTPRPIREVNPEIDEALATLIETLMRKRPSDRFQTAAEVAQALESELAHLQNPMGVPQPARDWRSKPPATDTGGGRSRAGSLTVLAAAGAAAALAVMFWPDGDSAGDKNGSLAGFGSTSQDPDKSIPPGARVAWAEREGAFEQTVTHSYAVEPGGSLRVRVDAGDVAITPTDAEAVSIDTVRTIATGDRAEARMIAGEHALTYRRTDDGIEILGAFDDALLSSDRADFVRAVRFDVRVPIAFRADIETKAGSITIGALQGKVVARAEHGDIELARIDGKVDAKTEGGDIEMIEGCTQDAELLAIRGDAHVAKVDTKAVVLTSGGDIRFGSSKGRLYGQTSGGDIYVDAIAGPTGGFASDGSVYVQVHDDPTENCRFEANDGNVNIHLADSVRTRLEARGDVVSAFEMTTENGEDGTSWQVTERNGGGARIRAASPTGRITLQGLQPAPRDAAEAPSDGELGGSGLGGSGLGGSSLGGSGQGDSGLGGRGEGAAPLLSYAARLRESGPPRAGALATVAFDDTTRVMDGYTIYLPRSHDPDARRYPVLVYLQGAYGVGGAIRSVNDWGLARLLRDETDASTERNRLLLDTFIVVCPHIQKGNYHDHPEVVREILDTVVTNHSGDPDRVYLTGLSRGGHGSWGLAAKLPGTFAAIAPIGGGASSVKNWDEWIDTAIWISHNRNDGVVPFQQAADAMRHVERETGGTFAKYDTLDVSGTDYLEQRYVLTSAPTDSHDAWTDIYTRPEFYRWLLRQERRETVEVESTSGR